MPRKAKAPTFTWANVSPDDQRKVLDIIGYDGHTIWRAEAIAEVNQSVADAFTRTERSDGSWKGSITRSDTGQMVGELRGIYGLSVIRSLAGFYHEESHKFGRGSEARELTAKIYAHIGGELKSAEADA